MRAEYDFIFKVKFAIGIVALQTLHAIGYTDINAIFRGRACFICTDSPSQADVVADVIENLDATYNELPYVRL